VRLLIVLLALALPAAAQDRPTPKKKGAAASAKAHKKATPEQIRRFDELEKKRQRDGK
jgi:hypothetical protein